MDDLGATRPHSTPGPAQRRGAWLLFGPLVAVVGLRWLLTWQADRAAALPDALPVWPLQAFVGTQDPFAALARLGWLSAAALALLALLGWAWWRSAAHPVWRRRLRLGLVGTWLLLCLAACVAQWRSHANRQHLVAQPPLSVQVVGSKMQPPSLRSTGGTLLVLQWPCLATDLDTRTDNPCTASGTETLQVLVDAPEAAQLAPGQWLQAQWARGARQGRFLQGWDSVGPVSVPEVPIQATGDSEK